jgi:hypothetical protein
MITTWTDRDSVGGEAAGSQVQQRPDPAADLGAGRDAVSRVIARDKPGDVENDRFRASTGRVSYWRSGTESPAVAEQHLPIGRRPGCAYSHAAAHPCPGPGRR